MSQQIEIACPGGKCPIKKSCWTHGRAGTMMPHAPFVQEGLLVKCNYFKLKPKQDVLEQKEIDAKVVEDTATNSDQAAIGQEARGIEVVAPSQGCLFTDPPVL